MAASYSAVSVGNTATLILAANNNRRGSIIFNLGAATVFIGMNASVTDATGLPVLTNGQFINSGQNEVWKGAIYGITTSGTGDIRYWEFTP